VPNRLNLPLDDTARRLLSIDPGLGGTGWALWTHAKAPDAVGVRCEELANKLIFTVDEHAVMRDSTFVYLEMPQHMGGRKGIAAQAGSVYVLTFLVGYLAARLRPCQVIVVNPGEWKGQLPKDVVQRRIERIIGKRKCEDLGIKTHAWDAVGIGLHALGRFQ
jgi:hypothetical protein